MSQSVLLVQTSANRKSGERPLPPHLRAVDRRALEHEVFALVCRHMRTLTAWGSGDFDDLVQMAAERALRDLDQFEGRSSLSTWTFRVCYSALLNHRRWYRRWLRRFALSRSDAMPDAPAHPEGAGASLEWAERNRRVRVAVARLSPKRQAVVTMHDLDGRGVDEIAAVVGANVLTVRSRLRDGRRDLARFLSNDPYFGDEACGVRKEPGQ